MSITHRVKRLLGASLAGAMVLALMPAGIAAADVIDTDDVDACDLENYETPEFEDTSLGFWADEIECMASYGITEGQADGRFNSAGTVNRQQMALFIARLAAQALNGDLEIPESTDDAFDDIAGISPPEANDAINWLAELEITEGVGDGDSYNPGGVVTRQQMGSFIARAHDVLGVDLPDPSDEDVFGDTDTIASVHVENVLTLHAAGVVEGQADGNYNPGASITRGQMAGFVVRSIGVLESQDLWNGVPVVDRIVQASFTEAPELIATELVDETATQLAVRFTFDTELATLDDATAFSLHSYDTEVSNSSVGATGLDPNNDDSVIAVFDKNDVDWDNAVVAVVQAGAVTDAEGLQNPAGSNAVNAVEAELGVPALVSIGNFSAGTATTDATVDFTFDRPVVAGTVDWDEFSLIRSTGAVVDSNGAMGTVDGAVVTVRFDGDANTGLTSGVWNQVRRGYVLDGTVEATAAAGGEDTVEHSVNRGAGATQLPDVVSVEVDFDDDDLDVADVSVTFDAAVTEGFTLTIHHDDQGGPGAATTVLTIADPSNPVAGEDVSADGRTVTFEDRTLATDIFYLGVVTWQFDGTHDIVDTVALGGASFAAGETAGADAVDASIEVSDTALVTGDATEYTITVEFTEDVEFGNEQPTITAYAASGAEIALVSTDSLDGNQAEYVLDVTNDNEEDDLLDIVMIVVDGSQEDPFGYTSYPQALGL